MSGMYYLKETGAQVQEAITDVREKTVYDDATHIEHGLMSTDDKRKLDTLEADEPLSILEIEELLNF